MQLPWYSSWGGVRAARFHPSIAHSTVTRFLFSFHFRCHRCRCRRRSRLIRSILLFIQSIRIEYSIIMNIWWPFRNHSGIILERVNKRIASLFSLFVSHPIELSTKSETKYLAASNSKQLHEFVKRRQKIKVEIVPNCLQLHFNVNRFRQHRPMARWCS